MLLVAPNFPNQKDRVEDEAVMISTKKMMPRTSNATGAN